MAETFIGIGGTIIGVLLGWLLSRHTAREATQEERRHQETALIRERREDAAAALRDAVIEVRDKLPAVSMKPEEAIDALLEGHRVLRNAWNRASIIRDDQIDESFRALDMILYLAGDDSNNAKAGGTVNYWVLGVAVADLRVMLDAYLLREPLPEALFPSSAEQIDIAGDDDGLVLHKIWREVRSRERARRTA